MRKGTITAAIIGIIAGLAIFGSCRKVERFEFSREEQVLGNIKLIATLTGTFSDSTFNVGAPYTLHLFFESPDNDSVRITNLELNQGIGSAAVKVISPEMHALANSTGVKTVYIEIGKLCIEHKDCRVTFDMTNNNEPLRRVEVCIKRTYWSQWTTSWLEKLCSV
jgi:hypothetical protein